MYKALVSFTGRVSMVKGEVRDINDPVIVADLLRAKYIVDLEAKKKAAAKAAAEAKEAAKAAETAKKTTKRSSRRSSKRSSKGGESNE